MRALDGPLLRIFDLGGVFVFALSGASLAARKRFDLVGVVVLAGVTGVGGGILRDVMLGDTPPNALRTPLYLIVPAIAAAIVMAAHSVVQRLERHVLIFDAAGLSLFAVTGAIAALDHNAGWWAAILLGTISAVGGGALRDVLAGEAPVIFRADSGLYAIPAAVGAATTTLVWETDTLNVWTALIIAVAVFGFRLAALRHQWTAPHPRTAASAHS